MKQLNSFSIFCLTKQIYNLQNPKYTQGRYLNTINKTLTPIKTLSELAILADYSFTDTLIPNSKSKANGVDHTPRQVFSGHFVPVDPTPLQNSSYIAHSEIFFRELGFADSLAHDEDFIKMFCGDLSNLPKPLKRLGWATGYALSIYGTEYYEQCPFGSGNGYGDGRAVSIFEGVINNQRYEMQLKGGGKTPYCRGADGRAVLRSSISFTLKHKRVFGWGAYVLFRSSNISFFMFVHFKNRVCKTTLV